MGVVGEGEGHLRVEWRKWDSAGEGKWEWRGGKGIMVGKGEGQMEVDGREGRRAG